MSAPFVVAETPRRKVVWVVLALLFLNGMLSFRDWWPTPGVLPDHRLAPEFVWLWLALLALVAWRGSLSARALKLLTFVYLLLVLGRYGDVTVPSLFGRPLNLYWDGAHIPRFLWVSAQEWVWWKSLGLVLLIGFFFWGLFTVLQRAIAVSARDAVPYALRTRWVWAVTALAVGLAVATPWVYFTAPDGKLRRVALNGSDEKIVAEHPTPSPPAPGAVGDVALSPDGRWAYWGVGHDVVGVRLPVVP